MRGVWVLSLYMVNLVFVMIESALLSMVVLVGMCLSLAVKIALVYSFWMSVFWCSSRPWWRAWRLS